MSEPRTCEAATCPGFETAPAIGERYSVVAGRWFAVCKTCEPIFAALEREARAGAELAGVPRARYELRPLEPPAGS